MDLNLQECETYTTFDFGLQAGSLIADSDYIWCVSGKHGGNSLAIRNVHNKDETSLPFHQFGTAAPAGDQYTILAGKDFEYEQQKYLLLSLEVSSASNKKRYQLVVFKLSVSRVMLAFNLPYKATKLDVLVSNSHYIPCQKNPSFLGNMSVCAVVGCTGGYVCLLDVTPSEQVFGWLSNEYSPVDVYWHEGADLTDYDDIKTKKSYAISRKKVFGLLLNRKFISDNYFRYSMPDESVTASIPSDYVKVSSLQYEKKLDSLLVGFNFGCFQMWNMKTMSIESSSGYGENNKPVVGFSILQPQNDPTKCVFLMVAHSSAIIATEDKSQALKKCQSPSKSSKSANASTNKENLSDSVDEGDQEDEFEIDNDDDDDSDSSFILLYQLVYERSVNVFHNQNNFYTLYEGLNYCAISFEHEFTFETLRCIKTNYSNEVDSTFYAHNSSDDLTASHSKIVSIQTLSVMNNRLQTDLGCIIWSLIDSSTSSSYFYLSIFNLNNWYVQCMPSKMRPLTEIDSAGSVNKIRRNIYFTNYTLSVNSDLDCIKAMSVVDSKVKHIQNQNALSCGNNIMRQLSDDNGGEDEELDSEELKSMGYESNLEDDTYLSMYFDVLVLSAFFCLKVSIKPIEQQIHNVISKQEDLIHHPDKVYALLLRYHLLDKYVSNKQAGEPKFIPIFDYLLETAQIYPILKSLWKLKDEDTSILSDYSLKAVLDWSWSKVVRIKTETNNLYKLTSMLVNNYINDYAQYGQSEIQSEHLHELFQRQNNLLESLIQIFKQFIKLDTTSEGRIELNKKLCVIESLKCYIEHLSLFHKYDLLIPPPLRSRFTDNHHQHDSRTNYIKEMNVNFKIIHNKWKKRRQTNCDELVHAITSSFATPDDNKYPFTYMIDCIVEECKLYSNTAKLFNESLVYPPKTINDLLEICLECNLSTRMKQIIILYVLCDLMHTELSPDVQKYVLKLINAYCSTPFTLMSNSLDKELRERTSGSTSSIISLANATSDSDQQFSCLFDLVNGLYLIDVRQLDKSFKYMRATDCNYLEFYEKYFILYNAAHVNDFKAAVQYLWLFQKLNANSLGSSDLVDEIYMNQRAAVAGGESNLFNFLNKSKSLNLIELNRDQTCGYEQRMHFRLTITIYLANTLVNEAYDLMKPHIKHLKSWFNVNNLNVKLSKELIIHFFAESERFEQWKKVIKLSSLDNDLLLVLLSYLEAKQDLKSICTAIELQLNNRNYKRATELYDKYNKQIINSEFKYLASMIEIAKSMQSQSIRDENGALFNKQVWLISPADIKDTLGFQYRFTTSLRELSKKSKRCMKFLDSNQDSDYINLLKLPVINLAESAANNVRFCPTTPTRSNQSLLGSLASSHLKRKASTPHPFAPGIRDTARKSLAAASPHRGVLTSSLKQSRPSDAANNSLISTNSKSVKFKLTEFTKKDTSANECDLNSSSFNRSGDKSNLVDLENDEPVVDAHVECDIKATRLEFNEKDNEEPNDDDYQIEEDEEDEPVATRSNKKARPSTPSPVKSPETKSKKSLSPVKRVEETVEVASPSKSPLRSSPRRSPKNPPATLCAETLACLNETFEAQEEINLIEANSVLVELTSDQVEQTTTSKVQIEIVSQQDREEQKEEERLARSNFETETDNDYLAQLNHRKTNRLSGLDQNEPADSHRSTASLLEVSLSLPTRPANEPIEAETNDEENTQEEYEDQQEAMDTSIGDHRNTEPLVEPIEMPSPREEIRLFLPIIHHSSQSQSTNIESEITTNETINQVDTESSVQHEELASMNVIGAEADSTTPALGENEAILSQATSIASNATIVSSPVSVTDNIGQNFEEQEPNELVSPIREDDLTLPSLNTSANQRNEQELNDSAGDLNMSSISSRAINDDATNTTPTQSPDGNIIKPIESEFNISQSNVTSNLTNVSGMTRTNSEWSLYSQISSVSEHYERTKQADQSQNNTLTNEDDLDGTTSKRRQSNIKRRAPVRGRRTMEVKLEKQDDTVNETASVVGDDDEDDKASVASRVSLRRRRSDASSIASSASITIKEPVVAEKRLTRGRKLKSLVELPASDLLPTHTDITSSIKSTTVTRRNSSKKTADSSSTVSSTPVIMSASNLKKYNAIMEEQQPTETRTTRSTRSRAAKSRSPSASSVVSLASSVTSSVSSLRPKRVASTRKKPAQVEEKKETEKTIICDDDEESSKCQISPSNSVLSIASSVASTSRTTRRTTRKIKDEMDLLSASVKKDEQPSTPSMASVTRSYSSRNYNLRSKLDTPKVEATLDDESDSVISTASNTAATTTTRVPTLRRVRTARGGSTTVKKEPAPVSDDLPDL